ncbi:putative membrane protein YeiB [Streptomyces sp. PvR006]|uniref:DUF418 domain-containing protein n=1 Tax=Streptomyces sp. PvR006 TaxID=2817860 RepID=UPI0027DE9051|nr:DUF418 domain-containing protein [Streptomyces sp. PvR006]MBP2580575.1 putative membrane protein YeiB [Streptomyces sp. PvR006]
MTAGTVAGLLAAVGGLGAAGWAPGASAAVRERAAAPAVRAAGVPGDGGLCGVSVPYTAGVGGYASYRIPAVVRTPAGTLLAFAAGRVGALGDPARHRRTLVRLQWAGFTVGLLGAVVYAHANLVAPGGAYQALAVAVDVLTAPLLAAAYAATVLRLAQGRWGERTVAVLGPVGSMTLTGYLTQSLVCALLFTGYGAGLVGRVPPPGVLAIAVALFAVQVGASRWWLRRYRYGPAEWLLRAWITLTRPPLRRAGAPGPWTSPGR